MITRLFFALGTMIGLGLVCLSCGTSAPNGCQKDADCPQEAFCQATRLQTQTVGLCVKFVSKAALNSSCKQDGDCVSSFCFQPGKEPAYCTQNCKSDIDCVAGMNCKEVAKGLQICVRDVVIPLPNKGCECGKDGASCVLHGHSDCDATAGYYCLSKGTNDPNARCVKSCSVTSQPGQPNACPDGFVCSSTVNGVAVCVKSPYTRGDLGGNCARAGAAECKESLYCYTRYPNDREAFCTKGCNPYQEGDCGPGFACESPRDQDPFLCIKRGQKTLGADCKERLFFDCDSAVCVSMSRQSSEYFCSQSCDPSNDTCPVGFTCELFGHLYRYLCAPTEGALLGSVCNKFGNQECKSKLCILPKVGSINKICSQPCDEKTPCPGGWDCDAAQKACVPKTGNKKIGEACTATDECIHGACISDAGGNQYCSQVCNEDGQCPEKFECRYLGFTQKYCLPKQLGTNKMGEACPNGPGDCADRYCLTDILQGTTFCTRPCSDADPNTQCPDPYVCTKINDQEAYCTPKGFQLP